MDLFTYLLGKEGKNSLVHKGDLFAYLLGSKKQKNAKTVSGTTISITDALHKKIESLLMTKESTQDNIAYIDIGEWEQGTINADTGLNQTSSNLVRTIDYIRVFPGIEYTITRSKATSYNSYRFYDENKNYLGGQTVIDMTSSLNTKNMQANEFNQKFTINTTTVSYMRIADATNDLTTVYSLSTDTTPSPNYPQEVITVKNNVNVLVSDGTNTNTYTISLGDNEVCGIGDYKDELLVDNKGHCYLNKKIGKVILNGSENWSSMVWTSPKYAYRTNISDIKIITDVDTESNMLSNYYKSYSFNGLNSADINNGICNRINQTQLIIRNDNYTTTNDFKQWLTEHNTIVYYPLATPQLIDLNTTVDITLFAGTNNISNSDNMYMVLKYY